MVQTLILTDIRILATLLRPPSATLHATCLTPPGSRLLQLTKSQDRACRSVHGSILSSEIGSVFPLESVLASESEVYLGAYSEVFLGVS